jgi:hypothetical protein
MTKKKTPTTTDAKPITPPLTRDERTAKFAELAQNTADLLTCGSAFQKVGRNERAFAMIEEARKCIAALAAEYPSDPTADIFTGPPKAPTARSHKRKVDVGAPAID